MQTELKGQYSGFISRGIGFLVDLLIIGLTLFASYWVVSGILYLFTGSMLFRCPQSGTFPLRSMVCHITNWGYGIFAIPFPLEYVLFFWILTGQTIGGAFAGIRVIRTDGHRIRLGQGCIRFFGYILCILTLGLGFLWILVDDKRQGLHDKMAGTCVIYGWEARQNWKFIRRLNQRLFGKPQQT